MKKYIIIIIALFVFTLSSCEQQQDTTNVLDDAYQSLQIPAELETYQLPTVIGDVTITWSANMEGILTSGYQTIQQDADTDVSLTALLTYGEKSITKLFNVTILKDPDVSTVNTGDPVIMMDPSYIYVTQVNTIWVDEGCTASDPDDGIVACTLTSGTVDTTTIGANTLTYSATDQNGNTTTFSVEVDVLQDISFLSMDLDSYYDDAEGLYGTDLLLALRQIINTGFQGVTYGDSRYILDETDADSSNPSNLILVYLQTSVSGVWDSGVTWNREHVWPQSLLGVTASNTVVNEASDLQNLKPADPAENGFRSNKDYEDVSNSLSYTPPTISEGDLARILFYMTVMYDNLTLINGDPTTYQMGERDDLVAWYYADPVSAFEQHRNDVIYSYQHNRNPFIDYPQFLALIYWDDPVVQAQLSTTN